MKEKEPRDTMSALLRSNRGVYNWVVARLEGKEESSFGKRKQLISQVRKKGEVAI